MASRLLKSSRFRPAIGTVVFLAACLLWAPCASAGADIYKWTDAQGHVHYGDHPGASDAKPVQLRPEPPPDPETAARRARSAKLFRAIEEDNAEQARHEQKTAAKAARRAENCRRARERLDSAEHARYLYTQKDGQPRHILSDTERAAAMRHMQADVGKYCD